MSVFNFLNEKIFLYVFDNYLGTSIRKDLDFLLKSQYWTRDKLILYQNRLLKELINHCYCHVPYYKNLFHSLGITPWDITSIRDLKYLPILTKDVLRENILNGSMIADNISKKQIISNSSSGSTGQPLQYYHHIRSESMKKSCAIRAWYWMGFKLGDKLLRVSPIERKGRLKKLQDIANRSHYVYLQSLSDENISFLIKKISAIKPKILRIYPDQLFILTKYMIGNGIYIDNIEAINTTGSNLTVELRSSAKDLFGCQIYDSYSCEGGASVMEVPNHKCYYSAMEYAVTEVLDVNDNHSNIGRLITTDLWNYATPFIRYDTQDIIELDENNNEGLELLRIKRIYGRESEILVTSDGKKYFVNNFTGIFQDIHGLKQFQIVQKEAEKFRVLIKVGDCESQIVVNKVKDALRFLFSDRNEVEIKVVDDIPLEKSGKRRFIIRDKSVSFSL